MVTLQTTTTKLSYITNICLGSFTCFVVFIGRHRHLPLWLLICAWVHISSDIGSLLLLSLVILCLFIKNRIDFMSVFCGGVFLRVISVFSLQLSFSPFLSFPPTQTHLSVFIHKHRLHNLKLRHIN